MTSAASPNASLRRRTLFAGAIAVIAAIGLGGATSAFAAPDLVDLKVVDRDTDRPLRVWRHHGRLFVAGEPGARYALRVTNHSGGRVLVVMSVDGVNILTGDTAGYDQRGYVLDAHRSYDLTGWRKSDSEVAAFVFAPLPQSYAARTGRPADVGVIGIAAFRERVVPVETSDVTAEGGMRDDIYERPAPASPAAPPPPPPPQMTFAARAAAPAPSPTDRVGEAVVTGSRIHGGAEGYVSAAPITRPEEKLGTGHGAREWSVTHTVPFERATSYPQTTQQIEYDTYANLVASGVIRTSDTPRHPRPFPSKPEGEGYVPDPPRAY
jgi:hypothetical protein